MRKKSPGRIKEELLSTGKCCWDWIKFKRGGEKCKSAKHSNLNNQEYGLCQREDGSNGG